MAPKIKEKQDSMGLLDQYLKDNSEFHYAFDGSIDYCVGSGSLNLDIEMGGGIHPGIIRSSGVTEGGKAVPLWTRVTLPDGSQKPIGEIKTGDKIMGKNGKPTIVLGVYPQGVKKINKISFSDKTVAYCCDAHLWACKDSVARRSNRPDRVVETREIKSTIKYGNRNNWSIEHCSPMDFPEQKLKISPYLLGALLGDGCFSGNYIGFTNTDSQIIDKVSLLVKEAGDELKIRKENLQFGITGPNIKNSIKSLGLNGKLSNAKFIPEIYFKGSINQRLELLRGLMDTDGNIDKRGKGCRVQYCTVSEKLRDGIIYLVRSLGGSAWFAEKKPFFTYKGEVKSGQMAFVVTISFTNEVNPFYIPRKSQMFSTKYQKPYKYILSVEDFSEEEAVCIRVDAPDSLFVIDDFIPTHNSSNALSFAANFQKLHPSNGVVVYIKAEGRLSPDMIERSGVSTDPARWKVIPTNDYEFVIDLMRALIRDKDEGKYYFFIIDCLDALVPRNDLLKSATEANRTAGAALLTSDLLRKMAAAFSSRGHICFLISQVRSTIKINPYEKSAPQVTNASGGNAALHYSDWILEFQQRWQKDIIKDKNDKPVGHWCKIIFRKSPNEKTGQEVKYPIKYGRKNGQSVWVEYEIIDFLLTWEMAVAKVAWVTISDPLVKELADAGMTLEKSHNGVDNLRQYLEDNPLITEYLSNKFKSALNKV